MECARACTFCVAGGRGEFHVCGSEEPQQTARAGSVYASVALCGNADHPKQPPTISSPALRQLMSLLLRHCTILEASSRR